MQGNIDREYMNALAEAADEGEISEADVRRMSEGNAIEGEGKPPAHIEGSSNPKRAISI